MTDRANPIRDTDDEARALARGLLATSRTAALGVLDPVTGIPMVTRIAFAPHPDGGGLSLVSDLSAHSGALRADPRAGLLLGDPGAKGDPLIHPRLSLAASAVFPDLTAAERDELRDTWLALHPKSKLYIDFADFRFVRFEISNGFLNGGFGKAYALSKEDLRLT